MVRKKNDSTAMDPRIEALERRLQEFEVCNQRRFEESIVRIEEMFIAVWQQQQTKSLSQAKGQPVVLTDDRSGIPKLENFIDTKHTPDQHTLVEDKIEETVLEKEESSCQNSKNQGTTTSSSGSKKSDVETEYCKVPIWSKQNVSLALKMRGITVRWRRSRATQYSRIGSKNTSHRNGVQNCNDEMAEPSRPKHLGVLPVVSESVRTTSRTKRREEGQRVGNEPPPQPKPPDSSRLESSPSELRVSSPPTLPPQSAGQPAMALTRRVPPPKPPDWSDSVGGEGNKQWILLNLTRNRCEKDQNAQGESMLSPPFLVCASFLLFRLVSRTSCLFQLVYHTLNQVLLGVRLKRDKLLNKFLKNVPLDIEAAWLLFDKMLLREVTDGDIVILGYTRNNSIEINQSPHCDLNDNGTNEKDGTTCEDLCCVATFPEVSIDNSEVGSCSLLDGPILARIFHCLRSNSKSLVVALMTLQWGASVRCYKEVSMRVKLSSSGHYCHDTMLGTIMNSKITSIILMGCINITADMVEKIILSLPGLCTIDVRGCNQFGELTPTFTNVKGFTSWSLRMISIGKEVVLIPNMKAWSRAVGECKTSATMKHRHMRKGSSCEAAGDAAVCGGLILESNLSTIIFFLELLELLIFFSLF